MSERVLVLPTEVLRRAGMFQGFSPRIEHYLPRLIDTRHLQYLPREQAEHNREFKQLIPYVVLRHEGVIFHYRRCGGGEKRLNAKRSIGIGGHICSEDGRPDEHAYYAGMWRELNEEVEVTDNGSECCIGLINDDRTPVGQVHLGIVHILDLTSPAVRCREDSLIEGGFAYVETLRKDMGAFETWSQFLLESKWLEG